MDHPESDPVRVNEFNPMTVGMLAAGGRDAQLPCPGPYSCSGGGIGGFYDDGMLAPQIGFPCCAGT
jgi:hypothetical protein